MNIKSLKVKSLLTIIRVQDLHSSKLWEFKCRHHWLRQNDLEGLWHFILAIWNDPDLPNGCGLARVELHLFLRFPPEIFVLFCSAIFCANTSGRTWEKWVIIIIMKRLLNLWKYHISGISENASPWWVFRCVSYILLINMYVHPVTPDISVTMNGHGYTDIFR